MRNIVVMLSGLAAIVVALVILGATIGTSCTPSSAKSGPPSTTKSEPVVAPAPRHLAMEYATKYMTDRFKLFDKPDCAAWEDNGYNHLQTALCSIGDIILVYCHAGDGKPPNCEITVDKRPKPPEAELPKAKPKK